MLSHAKKILIVSAHADDMEIGCGGTVHKLTQEGKEVYQLILSFNMKGLSSKFTPQQIKAEVLASARTLGIKPKNVFMEKFENRTFPQYRQEILDTLWKYRRLINPDVVITMGIDDMHQDHVTVAQESLRAFKDCNMLSYGFDWNRLEKYTDFYSVLSPENLRKKIKAVMCYKSQAKGRVYFSPEYIRSLALTRGVEIKQKYVEVFNVIRLISL